LEKRAEESKQKEKPAAPLKLISPKPHDDDDDDFFFDDDDDAPLKLSLPGQKLAAEPAKQDKKPLQLKV